VKSKRKPDFRKWLKQCPFDAESRTIALPITLPVREGLLIASVAAHAGKEIQEVIEETIRESDSLMDQSNYPDNK
jgi:hypothetical protein